VTPIDRRGDGMVPCARTRELRLETLEVLRNQHVAFHRVPRVKHGFHIRKRHVEIAETLDHLRLRDLVVRAVTIAGRRVDGRGLEQTNLVIVPEHLCEGQVCQQGAGG
jgi:hypothetical protein